MEVPVVADPREHSVSSAVAVLSCHEAPSAVPPLRVVGQVCRKRTYSHNLVFLSLRHASTPAEWDAQAPRLQLVARLQALGDEPMSKVRRIVKLGDIVDVVGQVQAGDVGPELLLSNCSVRERWAVVCRGRGFQPDIEPPPPVSNVSFTRTKRGAGEALASTELGVGPDEAPLCKFWINQGVCKRKGCRFRHRTPGDNRPWKEIRTEWQRKRSAKRHAARQEARLEGDELHGDKRAKAARAQVFAQWLLDSFGKDTLNSGGGVIDVAGGRGELSFELAARCCVKCTLLEPRHAGKLSKTQRKYLSRQSKPILPRRVRAMLTRQGPVSVGLCSVSQTADGSEKLSAPNISSPPSSAGHQLEDCAATIAAKAQSGDKKAAAAVGWNDLPASAYANLDDVLDSAAIIVGLHPDQATEPIVRWATRKRISWAIVPCCVFAADAPDRRIPQQPDGRLVESYDDFVEWLEALGNTAAQQESEKVQRCFLPFVGKNQVLFQRFVSK